MGLLVSTPSLWPWFSTTCGVLALHWLIVPEYCPSHWVVVTSPWQLQTLLFMCHMCLCVCSVSVSSVSVCVWACSNSLPHLFIVTLDSTYWQWETWHVVPPSIASFCNSRAWYQSYMYTVFSSASCKNNWYNVSLTFFTIYVRYASVSVCYNYQTHITISAIHLP